MELDRRSFLITGSAAALAAPAATGSPSLLPELPIIDPHIHLWDLPGTTDPLAVKRFLVQDLMALMAGPHRIVGAMFVEASSMYRADGPQELRSLGETEFATGQAAMAQSGTYGNPRALRGIVGKVDFTLGDRAGEIIDRHVAAAGGRLKGIRQSFAYADFPIRGRASNPRYKDLLVNPQFYRAMARLAERKLVLDGWGYHFQLSQFADLARAFPGVTMVIDHCGAPLLEVPGHSRAELSADWRREMRALAALPNVHVKIGGLGQVTPGERSPARIAATTAADLVPIWRPFVETCIELFGTRRCMFESNYPSEAYTCRYEVVWNAFKTIAAGVSPDERADLFSRTASRVYGLED